MNVSFQISCRTFTSTTTVGKWCTRYLRVCSKTRLNVTRRELAVRLHRPLSYLIRNADVLRDVLLEFIAVFVVEFNDFKVVDLRDADADERLFIETTDKDLLKR